MKLKIYFQKANFKYANLSFNLKNTKLSKCFSEINNICVNTKNEAHHHKTLVLKKYQDLIDMKKLESNESQVNLISYLDNLLCELEFNKTKYEELSYEMTNFWNIEQEIKNTESKPGFFKSLFQRKVESKKEEINSEDLNKINKTKTKTKIRSLDEFKNYEKMLEKYNSLSNIRGLYIYGSPGSGKTYLMDMFYEFAPIKKRRCHFNEFMLDVHQQLHLLKENITYKQSDMDPLYILATEMAKSVQLLCFDELQVTDIADAVILKRLFEILYKNYVVVVCTSNRLPDRLYLQGLQRHLFIPFINEIKIKCRVISVNSKDFRVRHDIIGNRFLFPSKDGNIGTISVDSKFVTKYENITENLKYHLNKHKIGATDLNDTVNQKSKGKNYVVNDFIHSEFKRIFKTLTDGHTPKLKEIEVMQNRVIYCSKWIHGVGYFHFHELCEEPKGAADYIAVAQNCSTVLLEGIPKFDISINISAMRRFITLVSKFYQ